MYVCVLSVGALRLLSKSRVSKLGSN